MKQIGARHGRRAGEVAIAWTLRHPAVTAAIVGMRSAEQAAGVFGALEFRLSRGGDRRDRRFRQATAQGKISGADRPAVRAYCGGGLLIDHSASAIM